MRQSVAVEDQLDTKLESYHDLQQLKDDFGSQESFGIIVLPEKTYFTHSELCRLNLVFNNIVARSNSVSTWVTPMKIRRAKFYDTRLSYFPVIPFCDHPLPDNIRPLEALFGSPWKGLLFNENATDLAVNLAITQRTIRGPYGLFDAGAVEALMDDFSKDIQNHFYWTGTSVQQIFTMKGMSQSQEVNALVIAVILGVVWLISGRLVTGFIFLATLMWTGLVVYAGMALLDWPLDALSICLFLMLAVASLEDFIFLLLYLRDTGHTFNRSLHRFVLPSLFTSLTTFIGFASLSTSSLQNIRHFGIWAAVGSILEWTSIFFLLPAILSLRNSRISLVEPNRYHRFHSWIGKALLFSLPKGIARILLLVFVFFFYAFPHMRLAQTPTEIFPSNHPFQQSMDYIKKTRHWTADCSLVFEGSMNDTEKQKVLAKIKMDPLVTQIETAADMRDYVAGSLKNSILASTIESELNNSQFGERFKSPSGRERAILYLATTNTEKVENLRRKVEKLCPNKTCHLAGTFVAFADFSTSLIHTLFSSLGLSLLLVAMVIAYLTWALRRPQSWALIVSSFWGTAALLCGLYACDISMNLVTCIVASTLVGLTGDNAIQFLFARTKRLQVGIAKRGAAAILCATSMSLVSLCFLFSYFEAPRTLGISLAAGFMLALFGDLYILKSLTRSE